jgi:pilus assembly protein Flp/PilA
MRRWTRGQRDAGATAVEYGLMVALVVAVIVVVVATVGRQVSDMFNTVPGF